MTRYAKAIAAIFTALGTWGVTAATDGHFDAAEWFGFLGVAATASGVWAIPNSAPAAESP